MSKRKPKKKPLIRAIMHKVKQRNPYQIAFACSPDAAQPLHEYLLNNNPLYHYLLNEQDAEYVN